jgi:chemotaxis signal transduction protein
MQLIVFTIGDRYYSFSTEKVEEITTKLTATILPQGPSWAAGLVNLRGQVMTLVDLNNLLSDTDVTDSSWYNNTIIVNTNDNPLALKVGSVVGVTNVNESDFQTADQEEEAIVSGLVSVYDKIVSVIELDRIFGKEEVEVDVI